MSNESVETKSINKETWEEYFRQLNDNKDKELQEKNADKNNENTIMAKQTKLKNRKTPFKMKYAVSSSNRFCKNW